MQHHVHALNLGPYTIVRPLGSWGTAPRYLAIQGETGENRCLYRLDVCDSSADRRRFVEAVRRCAAVRLSHALPIEKFSFDREGVLWLVTPYLGNHEGLLTLDEITRARGEALGAIELERCVEHMLLALGEARRHNLSHGPIRREELLVDPRGSVWIELFGLRRALDTLGNPNEFVYRDEVRSLVAVAYELATGLTADEPRIRASRVAKRLPRAWDDWFEAGFDPFMGFANAQEALDALPGNTGAAAPREPVRVRTVAKGFRRTRV